MARCSGCHQPITFVRMAESGKLMPIDGQDPQGNVAAIKIANRWRSGRIITADKPIQPGEVPLRAHFSTCTQQRPKAKPRPSTQARPRSDALFRLALAPMAVVLSALIFALAASTASAAGSDSPTPYEVAADGIYLPEPLEDAGDINVRLADGRSVNLHLEAKCIIRSDAECAGARHQAAQLIGQTYVPWSAFGLDPDEVCVVWVQIHGDNAHHGEGGQPPVGAGCTTPSPTTTPSSKPTPTPSQTPTPSPTPTPSDPPTPTPSTTPSATPTPTPTPSDLDPGTPTPSPVTPSPGPSITPTISATTAPEPDPTTAAVSDELPTTGADVDLRIWLVIAALLATGTVLLAIRHTKGPHR